MQQVLKVKVPFADYATADDVVEMAERPSDADIVDLIKIESDRRGKRRRRS